MSAEGTASSSKIFGAYINKFYSKDADPVKFHHVDGQTLDKPTINPNSNEVLVKVKSVSINPVDYKIAEGALPLGLKFPLTLGRDVSGEVVQVGNEVKRFTVGDQVCGFYQGRRVGTLKEYAAFVEDELVHKPQQLTHEQASAYPLAGCTAIEMLKCHPQINSFLTQCETNVEQSKLPYQHNDNTAEQLKHPESQLNVLIFGVSGAVGSIAALLVKNLFAGNYCDKTCVVGVCSSANESFAKETLGVDYVVDYKSVGESNVCEHIVNNYKMNHFDIILDCVGSSQYYQSVCNYLDCNSKLSVFTTISTPNQYEYHLNFSNGLSFASYFISNKVKSFFSSFTNAPSFYLVTVSATYQEIALLMVCAEQYGFYKIFPLTTFNLNQVGEAFKKVKSQKTRGKNIVLVQQDDDSNKNSSNK